MLVVVWHYLLLIGQVEGLQLFALVIGVDLQKVVEVGCQDESTVLHQLQHGLQQLLARLLHFGLQVIEHLVQTVLEEGGPHIAGALQ